MLFSVVVWPRALSAAAATCARAGRGEPGQAGCGPGRPPVALLALPHGCLARGRTLHQAPPDAGGGMEGGEGSKLASTQASKRASKPREQAMLTASASNQSARPLPGWTAGSNRSRRAALGGERAQERQGWSHLPCQRCNSDSSGSAGSICSRPRCKPAAAPAAAPASTPCLHAACAGTRHRAAPCCGMGEGKCRQQRRKPNMSGMVRAARAHAVSQRMLQLLPPAGPAPAITSQAQQQQRRGPRPAGPRPAPSWPPCPLTRASPRCPRTAPPPPPPPSPRAPRCAWRWSRRRIERPRPWACTTSDVGGGCGGERGGLG